MVHLYCYLGYLLEKKMKKIIQNYLKLPDSTPRCVVAFLAGVLPGSAAIHLKQLNTFCMVSRMPGSPLYKHAMNVFTSLPRSATSWFFIIHRLCIQYGLPHPLDLLQNPPTKSSFNKKVKSLVIDHWEHKLRTEAAGLTLYGLHVPLTPLRYTRLAMLSRC